MKKMLMASISAAAALAAAETLAEDAISYEAADETVREAVEEVEDDGDHKWFSIHAYADIESAYISRGYVWDSKPYSAQFVDGEINLGEFGSLDASVWTMSALSDNGNSAAMRRYAYAEADYVIAYTYTMELAEKWNLRNTFSRQWVTNPGYHDAHTLCDWQVKQVLENPYITPYWRLRYIHKPRQSSYWMLGLKKRFDTSVEGLTFTVDFYADLGDGRHFRHLYGPHEGNPRGRYHSGLQALNLIFRLDYAITEHFGVFAYVGQFCLVSDDARDAIKASSAREAKRDLTVGGIGVSLDF